MTFAPVLPAGGFVGWKFLNRTMAAQKAALAASPATQRDEAHFREKIGSIKSAEELVADRRLLSVALTAYGLENDLGSKAFIKKVLSESTFEPKSLVNRLSDKRYLEFSKAFGFGDFKTPNTQLSDFADKILSQFASRRFETAVGEQNDDLRLALNARRELAVLAAKSNSADTKWFTILGSPPLRKVFDTAFGLPKSFASLDLDQQLGIYREKAEKLLGSTDPAVLADPAKVEDLVRGFLLRSEINAGSGAFSGGSAALTLLQNGSASLRAILRS